MKYIILIPAYEPDNKLLDLLKEINHKYEVIVVDDNNPDTEGRRLTEEKMFAFVGNQVVELKRTALGGLTIDIGLGEGEYRFILPNELKSISKNDE